MHYVAQKLNVLTLYKSNTGKGRGPVSALCSSASQHVTTQLWTITVIFAQTMFQCWFVRWSRRGCLCMSVRRTGPRMWSLTMGWVALEWWKNHWWMTNSMNKAHHSHRGHFQTETPCKEHQAMEGIWRMCHPKKGSLWRKERMNKQWGKPQGENCCNRGEPSSRDTTQRPVSIASNQVMMRRSPQVMEIMLYLLNMSFCLMDWANQICWNNKTNQKWNVIRLFNGRISRSYVVTLMRIMSSYKLSDTTNITNRYIFP